MVAYGHGRVFFHDLFIAKKRSVHLDGYINRDCAPGWEAAVGRRKEVVMSG